METPVVLAIIIGIAALVNVSVMLKASAESNA